MLLHCRYTNVYSPTRMSKQTAGKTQAGKF